MFSILRYQENVNLRFYLNSISITIIKQKQMINAGEDLGKAVSIYIWKKYQLEKKKSNYCRNLCGGLIHIYVHMVSD